MYYNGMFVMYLVTADSRELSTPFNKEAFSTANLWKKSGYGRVQVRREAYNTQEEFEAGTDPTTSDVQYEWEPLRGKDLEEQYHTLLGLVYASSMTEDEKQEMVNQFKKLAYSQYIIIEQQ